MLNCIDLTPKTNHQGIKNIYSQYLILMNYKKKHQMILVYDAVIKIKSDAVDGDIDDQSLTKEVYRLCQGYTVQNRQCGEKINILLKLYRSILSKYRYTSLE